MGAALGVTGVAGFRGGFFIVAAILAGGAAAVTWIELSGAAQRGTWVLAFAIIGVVIAGVLVDRAPLSKGRLQAEADRVELDFYRLEREVLSGNSRCKPCPTVERRFVGPDLIVEAALIEVAAVLASDSYPLKITTEARRTGRLTTATEAVRVDVVVRREASSTDVRLTFRNP